MDLIKEMGEANYLEIVKKEYYLNEKESNLPDPNLVFSAFQKKFDVIAELLNYEPIFEMLMSKGFDYLQKNNYSGFEIRIVVGISSMLRSDFSEMPNDEFIDSLHLMVTNWKEANPGTGSHPLTKRY